MYEREGGIDAITVFCMVQSPYPSIILFSVDMILVRKFTDESFFGPDPRGTRMGGYPHHYSRRIRGPHLTNTLIMEGIFSGAGTLSMIPLSLSSNMGHGWNFLYFIKEETKA